MNKNEEPPPPYSVDLPVETTPLVQSGRHRTRHRSRGVAAAALLFISLIICAVLFHPSTSATKEKVPDAPIRVAVIGAGPAGVSAAFTLDKLMEAKGIKTNITIFEKNIDVGGRLLLGRKSQADARDILNISPEDVASGNLLHNRILRERDATSLADGYGKNWESLKETSSVGFFDGETIITVATRPLEKSGWGEWLGRLFKYGASVWRAKKLPTGTMKDFQRLLDLKETYDDVGSMLAASENSGQVARTALQRLKLNGLSKKYTQEMLEPQVRRHTGQGIEELSDLALSMALDREDQGVQASDVGGQLLTTLRGFATKRKAQLKFSFKVSGLKREMDLEGKEFWILEYADNKKESEAAYETFDKVIIATP